MLEDLRSSAASSFYEEEPTESEEALEEHRRQRGPFLGMTAAQRFILALLLLMMTCVLGTFCLLVTEKMVLF
jgi:hypothetical protein